MIWVADSSLLTISSFVHAILLWKSSGKRQSTISLLQLHLHRRSTALRPRSYSQSSGSMSALASAGLETQAEQAVSSFSTVLSAEQLAQSQPLATPWCAPTVWNHQRFCVL